MNYIKSFCVILFLSLSFNSSFSQTIRTVTGIRASAFEHARISLLNDSVFNAYVSVRSNAYDGYINHIVYLKELPADSNAMITVKDLPLLNHTNLQKLEFADSTRLFFQKLPGCIANCHFLRRVLLENEKVLLTSSMTDDLNMLQYAAKIKVPYSVFLQFKTGTDGGKPIMITYIPKMFSNKSKNKLERLFKDYPMLKDKIENETYANNIDGLMQLLADFGRMKLN